MKNKKLNLNDIRVTSFVTSLEKNGQYTLKGGADAAITPGCGASFDRCPTLPIEDCNIPSYDPCFTIPVEQCNLSDLPAMCAIIATRVDLLNC
jgi:hypothetical protein